MTRALRFYNAGTDRWSERNDQPHPVPQREDLRRHGRRASRRRRGARGRRADRGGLGRPHPLRGRGGRRSPRPYADAGVDRRALPRARGEPRRRGHRPHARVAARAAPPPAPGGGVATRIHHGPRRGRRRLRTRAGDRRGSHRGTPAVLFRARPHPDRRARRFPQLRTGADALFVLARSAALRDRSGRDHRGPPRRTRGAAPGGDPDQDHGLRRGGVTERSDPEPPVFGGGDPRDRVGGALVGHLRDGPHLYSGGDPPVHRIRGALDRARQPHRCRNRGVRGRARRLRGPHAGHLRLPHPARRSGSPRSASTSSAR